MGWVFGCVAVVLALALAGWRFRGSRGKPAAYRAPSARDVLRTWSALRDVVVRQLGAIALRLGSNSGGSTFVGVLARPLEAAQRQETLLFSSVLDPIHVLFENPPAGFESGVAGRVLFPNHREDLPAPVTRAELLLLALHVGCSHGIERLAGRGVRLEDLEAALCLLNKEELDWLQALWNAAAPLWLRAAELEEEMSGVPHQFDPREVTTPFGVLPGGYWPAAYCRRRSLPESESEKPATMAAFFDPLFVRAGTTHNKVAKNEAHFMGAVSLSPRFVQLHIAQIAHDLSFRPAVLSIAGLFLDPRIDKVLQRGLGTEGAKHCIRAIQFLGKMPLADE